MRVSHFQWVGGSGGWASGFFAVEGHTTLRVSVALDVFRSLTHRVTCLLLEYNIMLTTERRDHSSSQIVRIVLVSARSSKTCVGQNQKKKVGPEDPEPGTMFFA